MSIVLTHKIDGKDVEHVAVDDDAAAVLEKSGWKRKNPTKAAAAKTEEK